FSQTWNTLEQDMPFSENCHQDVVDDVGISDNDLGNFLVDPPELPLERVALTLDFGYRIRHLDLLASTYRNGLRSVNWNRDHLRTPRRARISEAGGKHHRLVQQGPSSRSHRSRIRRAPLR